MASHNGRVFQQSMKKTAKELASSKKTFLQQSNESFANEKTFQLNNELWQLQEGSSHELASQCNREIWQLEEGSPEEMVSQDNNEDPTFEEGSAEAMDSEYNKVLRHFHEGPADEMASQYNKLRQHPEEFKSPDFKKQVASNHKSSNAETTVSDTISSFMDEISSVDRPPAQLRHSSRPRKAARHENSQLQSPGSKQPSGRYSTAMQRWLMEDVVDGGTVFFRQAILDQSDGKQND